MECKENHKKFSLAFKSKANMTNGNDIADDITDDNNAFDIFAHSCLY